MTQPLNRKTKQAIKDSIVAPAMMATGNPGWGIILNYDVTKNTATVLMSRQGSGAAGETYTGVPCPVNIGVQGVAPESGRSCWVDFKDGSAQRPIVTSFFNYEYNRFDYSRQTQARQVMPRFMFDM